MLRGLGVSLALPLLDAMVAAATPLAKTAAAPKTRFAAIEMVHGAAGSSKIGRARNLWSPKQEGRDFEITPTLEPLAAFQDYLTIISGTDLRNAMALAPAEEGADHTRSSAVFLTAAHPRMTEGSDIHLGPSIDQLYAQYIGKETPLPSLQLCIEDVGSLSGACGFGYSCVYANTISWSSPTTPLPMERNPRVVFEQLFGDGAAASERQARRAADRSVLDAILEEVGHLRKDLPLTDRQRIDDYLASVREVERRIQKIETFNKSGEARQLPDAPVGVPDSFDEHVKILFDLQVLAFQTDTTRVSAFKLGRDVSSRVYPESGVKTPFHALSHHGMNPERIEEFARLNRYHVSKVAYFIDRLKNTTDGAGNLLDNSLVLYGSPMGDSHVHEHKHIPLFLAGKAGGKLTGNRHVVCANGTPTANVHLSLLRKLDVPIARVGDSAGEVTL
ncbi:MAG: DUF1552 domain-containing protein [Armatimonas sp.]